MSSTKVYFQLWIIFYFHFHAQPAISFHLQLPDIRTFRSCNIDKIYQLGASFSDTGNRVVEDPMIASSRLPYGESTFLGPTGRYSDGLLVIDYIALAAGLPLLNPYLKDDANFSHGVNFAVGGATALPANNFRVNGTNSSLGVQLEWMSDHFASQRNTDMHSSPRSLNNALFLVGEIGRNDYYFASIEGKTIEEARLMVPQVAEIIKNAVRRVVDFGAAQVIVPGVFPLGCIPSFQLTDFKSNDESGEDQCARELNDFTEFHNEYLQQTLIALQEENPHTTIVYADYYNAFKWLLQNAPNLGFDAASELKGCCGNVGDSLINGCGSSNVRVCSNPDRYISWDGVHFTQRAHSVLATLVAADLVQKLNCDVQVEDY
ncbi:acetylajmalan esterase-like [Heracleum sosnowskyi]|uniref:Acetylajmalan esterase-like n=1 Tax=Heracleum sosnowskyi TaxID=360622 RepID=A0AAD8JHL5_9APIA|nr:acetylajmalan esterase-like [Heracleum sosnowskyi]